MKNLTALPIAVVVLDVSSSELPAQLPLVPNLQRGLVALKPRTYVRVKAEAGV